MPDSAYLPGMGSENAFVWDQKKEDKNLLFYLGEI